MLLVHAGALQRRHERGSRPTAGAQATLERQLVADELFNRKSDAWPHHSPLDCISLTKRSVEFKGNATVWGMSAECVVCKTARLFFGAFALYLAHDQDTVTFPIGCSAQGNRKLPEVPVEVLAMQRLAGSIP